MRRSLHRSVGLLIGLAVLSSGCIYQGYNRVTFQNPSRAAADVSEDTEEHVFTLFGLIDSTGTYTAGATDVSEACPDGFAEISVYQTGPQASWIPIVPLLVSPFVSQSSIEFRCLDQ